MTTIRSAATLLAAAALVPLAACQRAAPANDAAPSGAPATNYLAQIEALPEAQRDGVLLRAIRDSGQDCQGVTGSKRTQTGDGRPAWAATCTDKSTYVLVLGTGGVMTVVSAADVRSSGG